MINRKKLFFISNIAAPYMVKFCPFLNQYFNAQFWFHEHINKLRPDWWKIDLGENCHLLSKSIVKFRGKYLSISVISRLKEFNPDIVMVGGFAVPSYYLAYKWALRKNKKIIIFTESLRKNGKLRTKGIRTKIIEFLYRKADLILTNHEEATVQIRNLFSSIKEKIHQFHYPADINPYFLHPDRKKKKKYRLLFPNRLIKDYNPILALEIFKDLQKEYPNVEMCLNRDGPLYDECNRYIKENELKKVEFLSKIKSWDELHLIYKYSDILVFPATFSNGNFTIIESMASGMGIVISNKILGFQKMIQDNINGYICEPDKEQFLFAIKEYLNNPKKFKSHAKINREKTKSWTMQSTAELFFNLINTNLYNKKM